MRISTEGDQLTLFDLDSSFGRTSPEPSPPPGARTSGRCSKKSSELKTAPHMFLDLTPGAGNLLGLSYWEESSAYLGELWTLNTGPAPLKEENVFTLSRILQENVPRKYYLSRTACLGILRRAKIREKELPPRLEAALILQAGVANGLDTTGLFEMAAFTANQRDEVRDLHDIAGVLQARPGMKRQTFVAEPTFCLNDQGGNRMDVTENITATLRAHMDGHPPLVMGSQQGGAEICKDLCPTITSAAGMSGNNQPVLFENHGIDSRYTGPHEVAPTMSARYGTGGNNVPLLTDDADSFCIAGNIIDREAQNGGNGFGYQTDICYTLTGADRHAVFSRQQSDEFAENDVVATQSARQHKDATDLVCQPYQKTVRIIGYTDHKGINNQYVREDKCVIERRSLIRRLTPLECERLQGFPDGWTDIPGASDSARYKALGNSVAIPCVDYVLRGIAYFFT